MNKKKILKWIEEEFDLNMSDICHNGVFLSCDDDNDECNKIATAVSPTINVINRSIDEGVNILITHHALWISSSDVVLTGVNMQKVMLLIKNKITLVSMHAPIDSHEEFSHSAIAAKKLELKNIKRIQIDGAHAFAGDFEGDTEDLKSKLSDFYGKEGLHSIANNKAGKVCILSGGGSKLFKKAISLGYDTFVTGNSDEPNWNDSKDFCKNFLSYGHYSTEKCGMIELGNEISRKNGVEHIFIEEKNPF